MNQNFLLTAVFVCIGTITMAQKPTEGNASSLEVQLNLTGDASTITAPGLKYRYFLSPNMAIRFGLDIASTNEENNYTENPDGTGATGTETLKTSGWVVSPGFEYHLAGTEKLSPYLGLVIGIGGGKSTEEWSNFDGTGYAEGVSASLEQPYSQFGVGLLAGADFYFAQNFFVGAEFGLTMNTVTSKEGEFRYSDPNGSQVSKTPEAKSSDMGIGETAALRLGWRF